MPLSIAYQGRPGAYSEQAVKHYNIDANAIPHPSFKAALQALVDQQVDLAILPYKNSTAGYVLSCCEQLRKPWPIQRIAHFSIPIHHCLLAPSAEATITTALSHPQALQQCYHHLTQRHIHPEPFFDTAGAAEYLAQHQPENTAAIASELAAQHYGLKIIAKNFEDQPNNRTYFLVVEHVSP